MAKKWNGKEFDVKFFDDNGIEYSMHIMKYDLPQYVGDIIEIYKIIERIDDTKSLKKIAYRDKIKGSINIYLVNNGGKAKKIDDDIVAKAITDYNQD